MPHTNMIMTMADRKTKSLLKQIDTDHQQSLQSLQNKQKSV